MRQNKKRRERNQKRKVALKKVMKKMNGLIEEGNREEAEELLPELMSIADKAAGKGPLHDNKASRIKSKYARRVDELG